MGKTDKDNIRSITRDYTFDKGQTGTVCITSKGSRVTGCISTHYIESYPSGTSNSRGGSYNTGSGNSGSYSHDNPYKSQMNSEVVKQLANQINANESAIQKEMVRLRGLNPITDEDILRAVAIEVLGISSVEQQQALKDYQKEQEKALAGDVAKKITPFVNQLNTGEWHLGVHTASSDGRKSKNITYGLSNQILICLEYLKAHHGAIHKLKVMTFMQCDLIPEDMIYFGNTTLLYPLLLNYLDFSDNRIGSNGAIYLFNSFITLPGNGKYPAHDIINLNLSKNSIGDEGAAHISGYIRLGYVPNLKVLNLADNNITDKGAGYLAQGLESKGHTVKKLHLEGNNLKKGVFIHPMSKLAKGITGGIKILETKVTNIKDGVVKQGTFVFSSKEEKKAIIKDFLKTSQENGIDTKNVAVSKDLFTVIINGGKLFGILGFGWAKCAVVPDSFGSFVGDQIIAKASPLVGQIKQVMDITTCYFESFDETASSKEAIQFLGDLGLVTQAELLGGLE